MGIFRGRKSELSILKKKYDSDEFQMVILYGRRRIGKTELINEFTRKLPCKCISFTAVEQSEKELLSIMTETVLTALAPEMLGMIEFPGFEKLFEFIGNKAKEERIIFFIDEYPYLAKQCSYMQTLLQKVIDTMWKNTKLFFVICGSLVAFMKDEVLAESAPLHGRCNLELKLKPFNYIETAEFLNGYSYEEKAIVYGLTGGVAKYIEQFDTKKSLYENIIEEYYESGGYFSEEQVKTVISSDRKSPAVFNSIVSAIATGHTRNSEIAGCVGLDDISYPLKVMLNSEIIEKRMSKKPYYVLCDSMLFFWFRYVNRSVSLINAGKGRIFFENQIKGELHNFMGPVFEKMCRDYLFIKAGEGVFPLATDIDNFQNSVIDSEGNHKQIEIDLLGKNGRDIVIIGECKFKNELTDKETFEKFIEKASYIHSKNVLKCMFSLSGYTDYVRENANDIMLISIKDMYF